MGILAQAVSAGLTIGLLFLIQSVASNLIGPISSFALQLSLTPLSIPIVNQVILWSQLCAVFLVVFISVGKGVIENVFQKAANEETGSVTRWIFKSVCAIACVAAMPLICNCIIYFGSLAFSDLTGIARDFVGADGFNLGLSFPENSWWESIASLQFQALGIKLASGLLLVFVILFIIMNVYQILKRQIICMVVSIAATWVSIKAATDNTDDVIDVLVSLLGLVLIQLVQWLFLMIALYNLQTLNGGGAFLDADLTDQTTLYTIFFILALMGGALAVPTVMERYAFSTGRSGAGNMIAGAAVRTLFASPRNIATRTTSVLSSFKGSK